MNRYALQHIVDSAYCFPVSPKEMVIRLRAAAGDLQEAWIVYESKYQIGKFQKKKQMDLILRGSLYDYYSVTLSLEDTRLAYVFWLSDGTETGYFSEDGLTATYDFTKGYYNFFQYPYINEADILPKVSWLSSAVFYQIFVDRFLRGDREKDLSYINLEWGAKPTPKSFAGGDLKGILSKLDYIRGLGVDALYLTPVFTSPSNHKYDTVDYFEVDPQFGTNEDLRKLVTELHARGMRIVLDAVFNHVSEHNEKFLDVVKNGKNSRYYRWFVIHGERPETEPLNYEVFAGCKYMPKWNTSNPEVQDYLISIALHYIDEFGIDGWRLDVSDEISHDFWRKFRKAVKSHKADAVIIGENWHDASNYLRGDQYDSIMNYAFTKAALDYFAYGAMDAEKMACKLNDILSRNTDTVNDMMLNLLDSHDTDRFFSEVKEDRTALREALCLLYLFPGAPSVFYGTEVYTPGGYDPDCRRCMDWDKVDEETSVSELMRKLSAIRKKCGFAFDGTRIRASADGALLCIERKGKNAEAKLYINRTDKEGRDGEITVGPGSCRLLVDGETEYETV